MRKWPDFPPQCALSLCCSVSHIGCAAMDAYLSTNQNRDNFFEPPPVLIAADSESGKVRARQTVALAGLRVADAVGIDQARKRIAEQAAASALWVELDSDFGPATDALLDYIA